MSQTSRPIFVSLIQKIGNVLGNSRPAFAKTPSLYWKFVERSRIVSNEPREIYGFVKMFGGIW